MAGGWFEHPSLLGLFIPNLGRNIRTLPQPNQYARAIVLHYMGPLMNKAFCLLLVLAALLVIACGSDTPVASPAAPAQAEATAPPTAEPAPAPTPTEAAPSPTPTPKPLVEPTPSPAAAPSSTAAQDTAEVESNVSRFADETWAFLQKLTEEMSPRQSATAEEEAAAEYLRQELESLGYEVGLQPFTFERMAPERALRLPDGETLIGIPLRMSGLGTVSGPLVHVGLAKKDDIPDEGLTGRIALIQRGEILFEEKVSRVAGAGASAAVIYNNVPRLFAGVMESQADIPAMSLSQDDGKRLLEMMAAGTLDVTVSLETKTYSSRNVVAEFPGDSDSDRVLIVGAHYDTTPGTQGANDNGSGVASLMSVARELAEGPPLPFRLRFLLFGAEEVGLFGSHHYVGSLDQDEIDSIVAMINIDVPGSGKSLEAIGDTMLAAEAVRYAREHGIPIRREQSLDGASSDHAPFREAGVPVLFVLADDLSRINSPRDNIEFINPNRMGEAVSVVLNAIDALASRN